LSRKRLLYKPRERRNVGDVGLNVGTRIFIEGIRSEGPTRAIDGEA
jgi:hypothetical protein